MDFFDSMEKSEPQKLKKLKIIYSGSYIFFEDIENLLTAPVLRKITGDPKCGIRLDTLADKFARSEVFDFWRHIFRMRKDIPQKDLYSVWYNCFHSRQINRCQQSLRWPFSEGKKWVMIDDRTSLLPELTQHSLSDPLLIDCAAVRHRYCQLKKKGWELLRHADGDGRQMRKMQLPEILQKAISDGSGPGFCIAKDMTGKKFSFSLLGEILWTPAPANTRNLLRYLLEKDLLSTACNFTVEELCCYLVSQFPDELSVPHLEAVEAVHPGIFKEWRDAFGRNLLWYAMYNKKTGWFHPWSRLVPLLLEKGCDAENQNQLGLSWSFVNSQMTRTQKCEQMRIRYNSLGIQGMMLQKEQPLRKIQK